jgi:putative peptidoglycan lipid II flippase
MSGSGARIARSTGVLAMATALSRILGFIRDLLMAQLFGTLASAQAFVVAFRLPNLMRDLVAEGAVTSAFVPVLSWYRAKQAPTEFWRLSHALLARVLVLLCAIGLVGTLAAPQIVRMIAPGFLEDPEKFQLTVRLTRILFPFVVLVGLWAYFMGLLNSLRHFAVPALGPAILNAAMIIACVWFVPRTQPGVLALAISVMVGGVVQLLIQLPVAVRLGFRWRWQWTHPGSQDILRLLGPRTLGAAAYQVSVVIHTALASLSAIVGDGAVAALYFANRLVQLPLALFGTASAQASLPSLAEQAAHGDLAAFRATLLDVLRMVAFVMLPASVGLMVLAYPIVGGLFERGAFDHQATIMTAQALICYALGLLAYALSKILSGAFYALQDTRTPVRLATEAVIVNVILSVVLMWPLRVNGLALAAAVANTLNAYRLLRLMEQRLSATLLSPVVGGFARMLAASVVMGAGCWFVWTTSGFAARPVIGLPIIILLGMVFYGLACALVRVPELSKALRWVGQLPLIQPSASE